MSDDDKPKIVSLADARKSSKLDSSYHKYLKEREQERKAGDKSNNNDRIMKLHEGKEEVKAKLETIKSIIKIMESQARDRQKKLRLNPETGELHEPTRPSE